MSLNECIKIKRTRPKCSQLFPINCLVFIWSTLSSTQRIETKRHRVCLEVPEEVVPKDEDEEEEQYGKRPRLSLIPPRTVMSQDGKRNKGTITCVLLLTCTVLTVYRL